MYAAHCTLRRLPRRSLRRWVPGALLVAAMAPALAQADEPVPAPSRDFLFQQPRVVLGVRGGFVINRSDSEIHDFLEDELTLQDSDFYAGAFGLEVAVRVLSWLDVVTGFEISGHTASSEVRNFVGPVGESIEQKTRLSQSPLTFGVKLYPLERGRRVGSHAWIRRKVVPYVGGALGATWYELEQHGEFVDDMTLEIFHADLRTSDWGFSQHLFAGVDVRLTNRLGLVLEGRYQWAEADVRWDYVGFEPIDLDGGRVMVGLSWRL